MTHKKKRPDRRLKATRIIHHCAVCDQIEVEVCGDICDTCIHRGITRRFQDRERINPTIFEWLEAGRNVQKQR